MTAADPGTETDLVQRPQNPTVERLPAVPPAPSWLKPKMFELERIELFWRGVILVGTTVGVLEMLATPKFVMKPRGLIEELPMFLV